MSFGMIVDKLARRSNKFVTREELVSDCSKLGLDYYTLIRYLISNKYVETIFRGIFYVYSLEERKLGKADMSFFEVLKKALEIKGVKNWYFGLETALKFNNLTHEFFTVTYIMNDAIARTKARKIMGRKVKFHRFVGKMFSFGVVNHIFPYSDSEKTLLDLYYLKHYDKGNFEDLAKNLSKNKLMRYSKNYDKRTRDVVECMMK
jgi:hypothetical protein